MSETDVKFADALPAGTVLHGQKSEYKILEPFAQGGFSIIYKVADISDGTVYAAKEFFNMSWMDRDKGCDIVITGGNANNVRIGKERLRREAIILNEFSDDDRIVNIYDQFAENDTRYIIMEFIEGRSLQEVIEEEGPWEAGEVFRRFKPLMEVLEEIHKKNYVHRDISPDNIMIRDNGKLCLVDFGSANRFDLKREKNSMLKKDYYSAPEMLDPKKPRGSYTDVYSLCATMYYALTKVEPDDVSIRYPGDKITNPSRFGIKIKKRAEDILLKGMAYRSEERIQNMGILLRELDEVYPNITEEEAEKRRISRIRTAAAVLALIAVTLAFVSYNKERIMIGCNLTDTLKTTVKNADITGSEYDKALDEITDRFRALGGEKGVITDSRGDKSTVFKLAESSYNGIDPDWITEYLICRPLNIFIYRDDPTGGYLLAGQLIQGEDITDVSSRADGIEIRLSASASEKLRSLTDDPDQRLYLAFDSDAYENYLKIEAKADGDGSILLLRDEEHPVPDDLLIYALTHDPLPAAFEFACQKAIMWDDPESSLTAGMNQVRESEIPGTAVLIYYKSSFYDPKKRGEELQFQYILKNRLDSLRIPYAIGKEKFGDGSYVVKMTRGAVYNEEIMMLGRTVKLMIGDENGSDDSGIVNSEPAADQGQTGILITFDDLEKEKCKKLLGQMQANHKKSACLYVTDLSSKKLFMSGGLDQALSSLQKENSIYFDSCNVKKEAEDDRMSVECFLNFVIASASENPIRAYSADEIGVFERDYTPVITDDTSVENALLEEAGRDQADSVIAFMKQNADKLDCAYSCSSEGFGEEKLEILLNNCDSGTVSEAFGRLRKIMESNHLESGTFNDVSVYFNMADRSRLLFAHLKYSLQSGGLELERVHVYENDGEEKEQLSDSIFGIISGDTYYKRLLLKEKKDIFVN